MTIVNFPEIHQLAEKMSFLDEASFGRIEAYVLGMIAGWQAANQVVHSEESGEHEKSAEREPVPLA